MRRTAQIFENIPITAIAAEGKAICRIGEMVVFVPWAAPGDVADIQIIRQKHSYAEGRIVQLRKASSMRRRPRCQHFGICGGCAWQHIPYAEQLRAKEQQVADQLSRIGKVPLPPILPILGSDNEYEYRNKLEFAFSNRRWLTADEIASHGEMDNRDALGFHIAGAWDKVYPIEQCHLMHPLHNDIRNAIRDYALAHDLSFSDLRNNVGLLRGMVLRRATHGAWMLIMLFRFAENSDDEQHAKRLLQHIAEQFPQITALLYVNNHKCNDTFGDLPVHVFCGEEHIIEQMDDLLFMVGAKSFYQTNSAQAQRLYSVVRQFAQLTGKERVYDLYTGTGTIANFVARHCQYVVGIEYVAEAVADARRNSEINHIANTEFIAGDMKNILTPAFITAHGQPDIIITDPPRAGMHSSVVEVVLAAAPTRIVYVSCNPATQARDISLMSSKYTVAAVQPVDMFPQTPHVENVVLLERKCGL